VALYHALFGFTSAWRVFIADGRGAGLRAQTLMLAVAVLLFRRGVVTTLLAAGCPLDLDASAFPVGMCTRTMLAKAEIVLWRTDPQVFRVEVWRSFVAYVSQFLGEAARGII